MKKLFSLALASFMCLTMLAACAPARDQLDPAIKLASSDAAAYAEWLDGRLDAIPDDVVIGIGSNETYGIDMTNFDDDGYIARTIDGQAVIFGKTAGGLDRAVREYAKSVDAGTSAELDAVYGEGAWIEKLTIDGVDISEFTIVTVVEEKTAQSATGKTFNNAMTAANEFVRLLEEACGVILPVIEEGTESGEHFIRFGCLPEDGTYGEQSFTYEIKDGDLLINGMARTNGCMNAVYYFFEHELGWDGLMCCDSDLAEADEIDFENGLSVECDPMFDFFSFSTPYANKWQNECKYQYSGMINQACHGMQNGGYGFDVTWLYEEPVCYGAKDSFEFFYDAFLNTVSNKVSSGQVIGETLLYQDISHVDTADYCLCKECKTVFRKGGSVLSALPVNFGNNVAAQMEEDNYGGIKWLIFAYCGTNVPCTIIPRDDVWITFCTDSGTCRTHPLTGEECTQNCMDEARFEQIHDSDGIVNNRENAQWLRGWCELTDNLYVWHYAIAVPTYNYTLFYSLYEDFRFFYECGVKGFLWESEYYGTGLGRLRLEIASWFQWHPDATEEEYELARDEIMEREYGDGWEYVLDMIGLWRETESTVGCFEGGDLYNAWKTDWYDASIYAKNGDAMYDLLDLARTQALNAQQEKNIALLQTEVALKQCFSTYFKAYEDNDTELLAHLEERYSQIPMLGRIADFDWNKYPKFYADSQKVVVHGSLEDQAWLVWEWNREALLEDFGMIPTREKPQYYIDLMTATESAGE